MKTYSFTLPLGPSDNDYYGSVKGTGGRKRYIKPAGVAFRQEVWLALKLAKIPKLTGRLWVTVRIFPKTRGRTDPLNRAKALMDAMQHAGLYDDDEQLDDSRFIRSPVFSGGKCEVMIGEIDVENN
jgi:crossover junction endodeoxyribonuclease RusA